MKQPTDTEQEAQKIQQKFNSELSQYFDSYGMICNVQGELTGDVDFVDQGDSAWRTGIALICSAHENDINRVGDLIRSLDGSWSGAVTDTVSFLRDCPIQIDSMLMLADTPGIAGDQPIDPTTLRLLVTSGEKLFTYTPELKADGVILHSFYAPPPAQPLESRWNNLPESFKQGIDNICVLLGVTLLIQGDQFIPYDPGATTAPTPLPLSTLWKQLPEEFCSGFDTICVINSKVYITKGKNLIVYTDETVSQLEGGVKAITDQWPVLAEVQRTTGSGIEKKSFAEDLDAMLIIWGHLYVVKGEHLVRFDDPTGTAFNGVPIRHQGCFQPYSDDQLVTQMSGLFYTCKYLRPTEDHSSEDVASIKKQARALLSRFSRCLIDNGLFLDVYGNRWSYTQFAPDSFVVFLKILENLEMNEELIALTTYLGESFLEDNQENRLSLPTASDTYNNNFYQSAYQQVVNYAQDELNRSCLQENAEIALSIFGTPNPYNPLARPVQLATGLLENLWIDPKESYEKLTQAYAWWDYHDSSPPGLPSLPDQLLALCNHDHLIQGYYDSYGPQALIDALLPIVQELLNFMEEHHFGPPKTLDETVISVLESFGKTTLYGAEQCLVMDDHPNGYAAFLFFWKLMITCELSHDNELQGDLEGLRDLAKQLYIFSEWKDLALYNCLTMNETQQADTWRSEEKFWTYDGVWVVGCWPCWTYSDFAWQRTPNETPVPDNPPTPPTPVPPETIKIPRLDYLTLSYIYEKCVIEGINLEKQEP